MDLATTMSTDADPGRGWWLGRRGLEGLGRLSGALGEGGGWITVDIIC